MLKVDLPHKRNDSDDDDVMFYDDGVGGVDQVHEVLGRWLNPKSQSARD